MQQIPIFLASDENYAAFLTTTAYSILKNTKSFIKFYVLDGGIRPRTKNKIGKSLKNFSNYSIEYIDMSKFNLTQFPEIAHYSINTFSRYFIPELAPEIKKALYLDVDIIVKGDIKELFDIELNGCAIGAASENFYQKNGIYLKENIYPNLKDVNNYFNAGVLILNIEKIRNDKLMSLCINKTKELAHKLSTADQDILNIVFEDNVKHFSQKFNYMPDHYNFYENFYGIQKANELKNSSIILHYTAGKPWKKQSCENKIFWDTLKKTAFLKDVKKKYNNSFKIFAIEKDSKMRTKITIMNLIKITCK